MTAPLVLVDCGHIRDSFAGLGQVACQYARALVAAADGEFAFHFLAHPRFREFRALLAGAGCGLAIPRFSPFGALMRLANKEWTRYSYRGLGHCARHAIHRNCYRIPAADRAPFVLTIHDMHLLSEKEKRRAQAMRRLQNLVRRAGFVGFISEYARRIASEHLDFSATETRVIYNGVEKPARPQKPRWFGELPPAPFLFSVAQIAPSKNYGILPAMLAKLPQMNLIIAGRRKKYCAPQIEDAARREGVRERFAMPGEVGDGEKAWLLKHCAAFVFPSLREGFGMPVVEALHFGKPVFCFANTALPEVGGAHAFYWQDDSPAAMAELIQKILTTKNENHNVKTARQQWAAKFSWQNNAAAYLQIYRRLTNE